MQAVALILVAAATGANPWSLPEAEDSGPAPVERSALNDAALLAQRRAELSPAARRQPAPAAPARTNPYRRQGGVQPADYQQHPDAAGNIIQPAQYVQDAWPTTGANRRNREATATEPDRQTTPNLFGTSPDPGADPYRGDAGRELEIPSFGDDVAGQNPFTTASQPTGVSPRSQPHSPLSRDTIPGQPAKNVPVFDQPGAIDNQPTSRARQRIRQAQLDEPQQRGGTFQSNTRNANQDAPTLTDPYLNAAPAIPPVQHQVLQVKPPQPDAAASGGGAPPTKNIEANPPFVQTPDIEVGVTPQQRIKQPAEAVGDAAEQIRETAQGGGALLYLLLFASLGLNLYLGWIAWDTYNRYQDMVSDLRYAGTSNRRERDQFERRSERRLAESAY